MNEKEEENTWLWKKMRPRQLGSECFVPAMMRTSLEGKYLIGKSEGYSVTNIDKGTSVEDGVCNKRH